MAAPSSKLIKLRPPIVDESKLTNKEKIIVLKSSKLHGCVFPPWSASPTPSEFQDPWQDDTNFRLSQEQLDAFDGWKRPNKDTEQPADKGSKVDLVQDITTDCSVVASLCTLIARSERLGAQHEDIHGSIRFPQAISANGKYIYKLHFNGTFRKVTIDDRLPSSRASRFLHCIDRNDSSNVSLALIEKAYLKVRGGYDFAGSNSGTDLWILTGWIPEQLFLQSEDVIPRVLWRRIYNAYNYGDVLITLGTNKMSRREEKLLGLTSEHAYAVIDMKEMNGREMLLIKNPWSKGAVWTGHDDAAAQDDGTTPMGEGRIEDLPQGTFWMDLHNVVCHFHTIYLNWNPGLFNHRLDTHFLWDLSQDRGRRSTCSNPQFTLQTTETNTIYLVLTRHFRDQDTVSGEKNDYNPGFLALRAFESAYKVLINSRAIQQSHYLDAPNVLLRLEAPADTTYTIMVAEQDLPREELSFTLSGFSLRPLATFSPAKDEHSHLISRDGSWSSKTAGGNATSSNYSQNPQFSLDIPASTDMALLLETEKPDLAVNVRVVWAGGQRIPPVLMSRDVYGDSGEYLPGCTMLKIDKILPGIYTVVCSTFEAGQRGDFQLSLRSNVQGCQLKPLYQNEAGQVITRLPSAWIRKGVDRLLAPVTVSRNTRLRFLARNIAAAGGNPSSPLRLAIEYGQGPTKQTLLSSGEFTSKSELRTGEFDLSASVTKTTGPGVWLVIERVASLYDNGNEEIQIEILSNVPGIEVGPWGKESDDTIEEIKKRMAATRIS